MHEREGGQHDVVAGDYSTYNGLRIGLLARHTYNDSFKEFAKEKGFDCEIIYYETPTELTDALINDEVDALVNSYIRILEDESVIENFGQTPYYIMARREDQDLIDQIDNAIDCMNRETPNWRAELYNKYYGSQNQNTEFTDEETKLLAELQESGDVDVWMDVDGSYDKEGTFAYKTTDPYLTTTVSVLRKRGSSSKFQKLAMVSNNISIRQIISEMWPEVEVITLENNEDCVEAVTTGYVDGALLMSYTAQELARNDVQNRLSVDIVPGAALSMEMGVNARDDYHFYGLWEKALADIFRQLGEEIVQKNTEAVTETSIVAFLFDNPVYLMVVLAASFLILFFVILSVLSVKSKNKQQRIAAELAAALTSAKEANEVKQNFFSKMSHDIRTPLNVVLRMTQIAQKYKNDSARLERSL